MASVQAISLLIWILRGLKPFNERELSQVSVGGDTVYICCGRLLTIATEAGQSWKKGKIRI